LYKSKTIQLLKSFSKDELKRFGDFLESPYFNTNSRVTRLYTELKKHYPGFTNKGVEKENLYKKLFPGKEYNEQVMKNLISELLRLEKDFLSIDGYNNDPYRKSAGLISQLTMRQVSTLFNKETEAFKALAKQEKLPSDITEFYLHRIEENKFTNNVVNNRQSIASDNIEKSGEYITIFFLKTILRLTINYHINKFSFNLDIEKNFPERLIKSIDMKNLIDYMESMNIENTLSVKLGYYALVCVTNVDDDVSYRIYHDLLYGSLRKLKKDELHMFLHFMESICAHKINAGRGEFYNDLFETYEHEINNNLYNPDGDIITVMKFRNIYLTATRVGKYEWAEKFINDFKGKLHEENRQNIVELAMAQLMFEKKDFTKTLEHLNKIKTEQIFFKIDVKILSLKSFYELGHYESAISLIESFRRMLTSSASLTEQYSRKNINFINAVNSLIKLRAGSADDTPEKLIEKINGYELLANKKWLMEKIGAIENI
jgi:Txe/YoeB family toxin of Txe-Axe toxin-antitoxin module